MPTKHAKHGPSGLKYKHPDKDGCSHWRNDPHADKTAANAGTLQHDWMEEWGKFVLGLTPKDPGVPLTDEQLTYTAFCQKVVEPFLRQAEKAGLEEKVTITNAKGKTVTWGTSDVVLRTGNRLTLIDYKFGKGHIEPPAENMQAKAYVAGAFQGNPLAETAEFIFIVPRRDEVLRHTFKRDELLELVEEVEMVVAAAENPESPYNPSEETCVFCGEKPKCPAINTAVATVADKYGELELPDEFHSSAITSPDQMSKAMQAANIVERWAKSVRHHAMEMVLNGEEIPGYELKYRQGKRTVRDVQSTWGVLQNKTMLNLEEFLPACSVSISELEKVIKAQAPHGQKKALTEEVFETLQDAGILFRGGEISFLGKTLK